MKKAITCRPADLLEPGLEGYRRQCAEKDLPTDDEIAVLFTMFPQQVEVLIKGAPAAEAKPGQAKTPAVAADSRVVSREHMVLNIDGRRHEVCVEKLDS